MHKRKVKPIHLDPVSAYDQLAPEYASISARRTSYLARIEDLIISEIPRSSRSLLDVGAGDGVRASHIAKASCITDLTLLEPSAQMRKHWSPEIRGWPLRAEELAGKNETFDAITCLWNVLGHIFPAASRVSVLSHCARLLAPGGRIFVDVNHRYNTAHYGLLPAALWRLHDLVHPRETNRDLTVNWQVKDGRYATKGHVFTDAEFRHVVSSARLAIEKTYVVDYSTGKIRQSKFAGNLFYILQRPTACIPDVR